MFLANMQKAEFKAFLKECFVEILETEKNFLKDSLQSRTDELLTIKEVCDLLKISRQTVYNLIDRGKIQRLRVGKSIRFKISEIEKFHIP